MYHRFIGAEIIYSELVRVAGDLAMGKVQMGLSLANQGGEGDHRDRHGGAQCIFEVDNLSVMWVGKGKGK